VKDLTREERVRLIAKALKDCGQPVTPAAVAKQYRYETGETLGEEATHEVE
jgi:hypothetical protein